MMLTCREIIANDQITWHFNPPSSPHFGGLWEAGVKSTKAHLKKVIGEQILTFEEMITVLTQIESCLNSRPLAPISDDPNDCEVLTPGHFLIGEHMLVLPEKTEGEQSHLKNWKLVQKMVAHFWNRWTNEFLTRLQQRPKWTSERQNLQVGDIVLVKDEHYPPSKWPLARILEVHPGEDQLVRVVTVKLNGKPIKRPITKICFLPSNENYNTLQKTNSANQVCNSSKRQHNNKGKFLPINSNWLDPESVERMENAKRQKHQ